MLHYELQEHHGDVVVGVLLFHSVDVSSSGSVIDRNGDCSTTSLTCEPHTGQSFFNCTSESGLTFT